jgi:hypothetical protein
LEGNFLPSAGSADVNIPYLRDWAPPPNERHLLRRPFVGNSAVQLQSIYRSVAVISCRAMHDGKINFSRFPPPPLKATGDEAA